MDSKTLDALWRELEAARRSPQSAGDLERLATRCGRKLRTGGKHPMWLSPFPLHRPVPISRHGNREVAPHAQKVILNGLEADLAAWEATIEQEGANKSNGHGSVK